MIKIIEPGTRIVTVCEYCGCKFSYEKEDIKETKGYNMDPLSVQKSYVECPQCHKEIVLKSTR